MNIGARIKRIRLQLGLTQEELADRCELTKGYISQLENDVSSPSIATLIDILNVLGVTPAAFFASESDVQVVFTPSDYFVSENDGCTKTWLIPNSQKNEMEPIIVDLAEGAESETRDPFEGEEFGYVLSGRVIVRTETKEYKARKGDSFYIDGKYRHTIVNTGRGVARIMWIATPSNF